MRLLVPLTLLSALGSGLMAGFFFAFSVCVMRALGRLPPAHGIAAMQSINVVVINPLFLAVFFGTGVSCLAVAVASLAGGQRPGTVLLLVGASLYVVGSVVVTMVFNVPRNNALAAVDPASAAGASLWTSYLTAWTAWNHVRALAALAAAAFLTAGLRLLPR